MRIVISALSLFFLASAALDAADVSEAPTAAPSASSPSAALQAGPTVTEYGRVRGTVEDGLSVYRGIPFAAAPVGDLRWRPPQPAPKWDGVRETTKFAPDPIQGTGKGPEMSEDCLYLNVWTPAKTADEHLPVLVWIYGGGFNEGGTRWNPGEHLAGKGVVFISIAYRVGQLGFLAHPELSAESARHVSGNYGLLDQIAALKWIQRNIAAFGGDPAKVTIFGESAGAISVSMLCASPLAKNLFRGAISQSGGSFGPPRETTYPGENMKRLQVAEKAGEVYAKAAGVTSVAELRKLPPEALPHGRDVAWGWPIIDGWLIPDDQYKLYENGRYNDVDVIVGYNSDEAAYLFSAPTPDAHVAGVKARYGTFADRLLEAYPVSADRVNRTARNLNRDAAFGWHTWSWARLQSQTGKSRVYFYYFDQHPAHPRDSDKADFGSSHGHDVNYVFQHLDPKATDLTKTDFDVSNAMATYWTNFAKHGDPNGDRLPSWPEFTPKNAQLMYFSQGLHLGPVPDLEALSVLDAYFAWRRTPQGEAWAR